MKNEIKNLSVQLKLSLSTILYSALLHRINIAIISRSIAISRKHKKKILNLQHKQQKCYNSNVSYTPKEVVHNFSSYVVSQEEHEALSHGLEHHMPSKVTRNSVNTEFESFYQSLLRDISTISEKRIARIKTQLRSKCEKRLQGQSSFSIQTSNKKTSK